MKVALALPYVRPGFGIEHRTIRLAQDLPREIDRTLLCLLQDIPTRAPCIGFSGPTAAVLGRIRHSNVTRTLLENRFRAHLRKDWIVDAQYCPMTNLRPKGAFVVTWYSTPPLEYAGSGREARDWSRDRESMIDGAKRADLVLAISEAAAEEIGREIGSSERVKVLYIGCEPQIAQAPFAREMRRLVSVGRFALHKSHEDAIALLARVRRAMPERRVELTLCGTATKEGGSYVESLKSYAVSLGLSPGKDVHLITNATNRMVESILAVSDIFVSASRWEGFGMPLVEAQGVGLPSIAYRLWSHPEVVANADHLVAPGDVHALSEIVIGLLEDPGRWSKASDEARSFAMHRFPWSGFVEGYERLLRTL